MSKLTKAQALALSLGVEVEANPDIHYPKINPETPYIDQYDFFQKLAGLATGVPNLGSPTFSPPLVFKEDFIDTFYSKDLALTSESDPTGVFSVVADRAKWLVTIVDGDSDAGEVVGTPIDGAANASAQGGWGTFTTNDKQAGELVCCQLNGESFKLATGKKLWFECRMAIEDISATEVFIGLADTGTDHYVAGAGVSNHAGFMVDGDGVIDISVDEGGTQTKTDTTGDFVDGSIATLETANVVHRMGFLWDGAGTITPYIDGVAITAAAVVDNATTILIPDGTCLSPAFQVETDGATAETIWIDYIMIAQER